MAPSQTVRVLILGRTKLGESDCIMTMLALDGSQMRGIAKGVRKSGSRFGATLEPYTVCDIQLYTKRALPMITESKIVVSNKECRDELEGSAAAAVVAAALTKVSQEGQEEPRIFDLSVVALECIGQGAIESQSLVVSAYLLKLLAMIGFRPSLSNCVSCGDPVDLAQVERFSFTDGGVVCSSCVSLVPSVVVTPQMVKWIDYLLRERFDQIIELVVTPDEGKEIVQFARQWTQEQLGARLKPLDFFISLL